MHLFLPVKTFRLLWCFVALMIITVVSCKEPHVNEDPVDQLTGFDRIEVENYYIDDLGNFGHQPFLVDSLIYFITYGTGLINLEMVVYDLKGKVQSRNTFYTIHPEILDFKRSR
jgi:hypothetical protein